MTEQAITFDFHNTLVHCEHWFALEIRSLPSAFASWYREHRDGALDRVSSTELEASYRKLRSSIIDHGHELSAERCLSVVFARAGIHVEQEDLDAGVTELMASTLADARPIDGA